jgi:hypothetical protein
MTRPEATDIVGSLAWIMDKLADLEAGRMAQRLKATQAARALGLDEHYFNAKPWRIPEFGVTGLPPTLSEWQAWLEIPEKDRRVKWDSMDLATRRKIRTGS